MKAVWLALLVLCGVARADDDTSKSPTGDKPWAVGVPADKQHDALALYQKGNGFFEQSQYREAYEQYQQAIALWDHPAIRYNAAVCLINMDRPVEAYENLIAALRFGQAPLGADLYKQGLSYKKLLDQQVGQLTVKSEDAGAQISLDGKPLFESPGEKTRHVTVKDPHQVVAAKPGYETETRPVPRITPGVPLVIVIKLRPLAAARRLERRWPRWVPWSVVVGGAAIAIAGVPLYMGASDKFDRYDAAFRSACPTGCTKDELAAAQQGNADLRLESSAKTEAVISYSAFAVGGVAIAAGVALVVLNQPRLAPVVAQDRVGVAISGAW